MKLDVFLVRCLKQPYVHGEGSFSDVVSLLRQICVAMAPACSSNLASAR